jgi:hypothetical protein
METIGLVENSLGKTRLGQPEKMETFLKLMTENVQLEEIRELMGLG